MIEKVRLQIRERKAELGILIGTEGEIGIDIGKLRSQTGAITMDPGYVNTASCNSSITFLDGEKGILRYRGYPIEQLANHASFLEVSYLLIHGDLPTSRELEEYKGNITCHTMLHEELRHIYRAFPKGAHPMAMVSCVVNALSTFYPDFSATDQGSLDLTIWRLMGKLPTIASWAFKKNIGQPFIYPQNNLSYFANIMNMMFGIPGVDYEPPRAFLEALNVLFILQADHEQNCSTSTVRMVGSSQANLFSSIASGISALSGPLHGGANQAVVEMLYRIHEDGGHVGKFVDMAKDPNSNFRLMGFGHRVYKNFDPRARIIKKYCDKILGEIGLYDPFFEIAKQLEEVVMEDDFFKERKLYPNVEFYSGIIYRAIGFPIDMFTVLFALARIPGWIAHWTEMLKSSPKIGRPRQIYIGPTKRVFQPLESRR